MSTPDNETLKSKYEDFLHTEPITKSRRDKVLGFYNIISKEMQVPMYEATKEDIRKYVTRLHKNEIKRADGKPYSGNTKSDYKKFIKRFYKWLRANNETFPEEVAWINTAIAKDEKAKEKPVITPKEAEKLAHSLKNPEYSLLTLLLFDSGFRISEMLSIKKSNLSWEEFAKGEKCWWVECRESKTKTRKVPVPLFTDQITNFTQTPQFKSLSEDDKVFSVEYAAYNKQIKKYSRKILNKHITPHALRHSSATYYAKEFDGHSMMIAERFGWAYNSKELQTYIRRSGAYQRPQARKIYENKTGEIKKDLDITKEQNERLESEIHALKEQMRLVEDREQQVARIVIQALKDPEVRKKVESGLLV